MEKTYDELGQPGIFRNDRVWLAGDHVVDPRAKDHPKIKSLIEASEKARQVFKLSEYQGMNVGPILSVEPPESDFASVYYHAHRILPRTSTAWNANHWLRFSHLLRWLCVQFGYWSWCSRCHDASHNWRNVVQSP